jgi:predicted molibdopterin-dependent oxidoreductase YjgC
MCESAKYAHVVLPAASFLESDGTYTNGERRVQRIRKAIPPPGDAKEDWRIVSELAAVLGHQINASDSVSDIWDEITSLTPNFTGISYDILENVEAIQWPAPEKGHPGTTVMHSDVFSRGLGNFAAPEFAEPSEKASEEYPFILVTGRNLFHYNSGTQTRRAGLNEFHADDYLEIHPEDALSLDIIDDSRVWLSSPRNRIQMTAKITKDVQQGNLFTTFHFPETGVNTVLSSSSDSYTRCPEYKVQAVAVSPV